jgi:hypothetical protein
MRSRREHAQRPGGTRKKALSDDLSEPPTCNKLTKGWREPEVRALDWVECAVMHAGIDRAWVTVRTREKVATAQGSTVRG